MDGGKRGQVVKVCADPSLPHPPSQHAFSAASRAGAGGGTEAHRKGETGHYDSPSCLGYDPPTRLGSVKEGRLAGGRPLPDRPPFLQPGPGSGEAAQGRGEEGLCVRAGASGQASGHATTRPNFASCFSKSVCWIRRISDPPPAATTFSWTPPNATEWILKSCKRPWQRNLQRNERKRRRRESSRKAARRPSAIPLDSRRSASLHSAILYGIGARRSGVNGPQNRDR